MQLCVLADVIVTRLPDRGLSSRAASGRPLAVLAVALVVVASLVAGCGGSTPKPAVLPPVHPHRAGPESMFTAAVELTGNPVGTLNALKTLGVDRIHIYMHWADIAPEPTSAHRGGGGTSARSTPIPRAWASRMTASKAAHPVAG